MRGTLSVVYGGMPSSDGTVIDPSLVHLGRVTTVIGFVRGGMIIQNTLTSGVNVTVIPLPERRAPRASTSLFLVTVGITTIHGTATSLPTHLDGGRHLSRIGVATQDLVAGGYLVRPFGNVSTENRRTILGDEIVFPLTPSHGFSVREAHLARGGATKTRVTELIV